MSSAPYTSHHSEGASPLFAVVSLLLGLLVGVLAFVAIFMWLDAHAAKDAANRAAADVSSASGGNSAHAMANMGDLTSYAAAAPANAMDIAMKHAAFPAQLPAAPAGAVAKYNLVLKDVTVQIAPGSQVRGVGLGGRRSRPGHPRPAGTDCRHHAHQQGRDPAFDRLPRRACGAERLLQGRESR